MGWIVLGSMLLGAVFAWWLTRKVVRIIEELEREEDGLPRSGQRMLEDPGVAVYWKTSNDPVHKVIAIDQYQRVEDNLAAIAATLEAMRAIDRHGGAMILERAFVGFTALPSPNDWRHVLGFEETPPLEEVEKKFKSLCRKYHPDIGGNETRMAEINRAMQDARRELVS